MEENNFSRYDPTPFADRAFILGLVSICICWLGLLGVIPGIIGIVQANKGLKSSKVAKARTARILSIIGLVLSSIFMIGGFVIEMRLYFQ